MPRQQRRVIADAAEARAGERVVADARMRMRRDDQVGVVRNRSGGHELRVVEDAHRHAGRLRRNSEPIVRRRYDDPRNLDAVIVQRLEHAGAEVAGSNQRALHGDLPFIDWGPAGSWR